MNKKKREGFRSFESVELIASGYEWVCPHCDILNKEIEVPVRVTCRKCRSQLRVRNAEHAYG